MGAASFSDAEHRLGSADAMDLGGLRAAIGHLVTPSGPLDGGVGPSTFDER
jgi:hypothetical protein